jgi:Arc/MetJ-type ribon-helix-helix transcriptional regulator
MPKKAKKITIDVPLPMYEAIEKSREKGTSTSAFVRCAIERSLRSIERAKLERKLKDGYIANAAMGDQIAKEFEFVDAETAGQIE